MLRVCAFLGAIAFLCRAATPPKTGEPTSTQTFSQAREKVLQQLRQSTNYTCTEVVDRSYFYNVANREETCNHREDSFSQRPYLHDRLRLDVAVSEGGEIFSWHGGKEFSSSGIETIVKTGAVSSGSFIGYLRNVFGRVGVIVQYAGHVTGSAGAMSLFNYDVPLASSSQNLQVGAGKVKVPFHGSFAVNDDSFQLTSLDVVIDKTPPKSDICHASMEIHYQMATISEQLSLIPKLFVLKLDTAGHQSSTSRTDFTDCHAFRGESTIHYTDLDDAGSSRTQTGPPQELPNRIKLHAALTTPIDDKDSYTGDPVEATLLSPVAVRGTNISLHKGATLKGVITKLEFHYEPAPHYLLGIRLDSMIDGRSSYRFDSVLQTPASSKVGLMQLYRVTFQDLITADASGGEFLFEGRTFHTSNSTNATWITSGGGGE